MALLDDINRLLRDHTGYTGDGQGGVGALPVGDRSTARYTIDKRDLRDLMRGIAQAMGDPSALASLIAQLDGKAALVDSGKIYASRAAAITAGQAAIPGALGRIITIEGDELVVRGSNQTDDALFATFPRWGIVAKYPNSAALDTKADLAALTAERSDRLTGVAQGGTVILESAAGTADAYTATMPSLLAATGVSAVNIRRISFAVSAANTGLVAPTLTIDGITGPVGIYTRRNGVPAAGSLVPGRYYEAIRIGGRWRLMSSVGSEDLDEVRASVVNSIGACELTDVAGTPDAVTAKIAAAAIAAGATASASRIFDFTPVAANVTTLPTLLIEGDTAARLMTRSDGTVLAIADLQVGVSVRLARVGTQYRVLSRLPSEIAAQALAAISASSTVTASSAAALRTLGAAAYALYPCRVRFETGTVMGGVPTGAATTLTAPTDSWTVMEGASVFQYYRDGTKLWRRPAGGAWQAVDVRMAAADLSAANRSFNSAVLLEPGTSLVLDGSLTFTNGPLGNAGYVGFLKVDRYGDEIRQRVWLNGDETPFTRFGGSSGSWTRAVLGLIGYSIVFLGDSITHGVGTANSATDSFPVIASRRLGCSFVKAGTAGAQMDSTTANTAPQKAGSFVEAVTAHSAEIAAADRVVVAYGTNDFNRSTVIGSISDTARGTFFGAMREGTAVAVNANPAAKLVFLTPLYRAISTTNPAEDISANSAGHTLEDYRNAIRQFADRFGYPVIEGRKGVGINEDNVHDLAPDGLHPNTVGARMWGEVVSRDIL